MKWKTPSIGAALVAALMLTASLLSACGSDGSSDSSGGGDDNFSIGIVRFAPSELNTEKIINQYVADGEAKGWKISTTNPDASVDKAIGAMQDFVQKDVDLIIVAVFDSKTLGAGLRAAKEAGIPVASIAGGQADGVTYDVQVASGVAVAEQMIKDMNGTGRILALGYKTVPSCGSREVALDEVLKDTNIKADREQVQIPGQVELGQKYAAAWLAKNPKGSEPLSIWACFSDPALGAVVAAQQAGRTDVSIYTYDTVPAAVKALKDKKLRVVAAADIETSSKQLIDATPDLIKGGPDAKVKIDTLPYNPVTWDTVDEYIKNNPGAEG